MNRGGCAWLGCAVVLALAVTAVVVLPNLLSRLMDRYASVEPAPDPEPLPEVEATPEVEPAAPAPRGRYRDFQRDDVLRLSYGFTDHSERPHQVSCAIRKEDYEREVASFGYEEDRIAALLEEQVRALVDREARIRDLDAWFSFRLDAEGSSWKYDWRWTVPGDLAPRVRQRIDALDEWLERDLPREIEAVADRLYQERGFRLRNDQIGIDYERIAVRGTEPLADCFQALRAAGRGESEARLLSLFLSFFQDLRYHEPPEHELGRRTNGFWVPTEVLVRRAGDCDSKSVAFCSLWRNLPKQAAIILVPGHALVAVEARPGPDEAFIRIGNRYFVLCEVAGPARTPPGGKAISGSFEYVLIEPAVRG